MAKKLYEENNIQATANEIRNWSGAYGEKFKVSEFPHRIYRCYDNGYRNGLSAGVEQGYKSGLADGIESGYASGKKEFLNVFWNSNLLYSDMILTNGVAELNDGYVTITSTQRREVYFQLNIPESTITGEFFVIKYKTSTRDYFELFTSTLSSEASSGDNMSAEVISDNGWNIVVFNAAKYNPTRFSKDADGNYRAKYVRLDTHTSSVSPHDVDIAYIGICNSLEKALAFVDSDRISYVEASNQSRTLFTHYDKVATFSSTEGLSFIENKACSECGIKEYAVSGYDGIDSVINIPTVYIDDGGVYPVTQIKANAFYSKQQTIAKVAIPSSVRHIGEYAFYATYGIVDLEIPKGVQEIGKWAFYNLWKLEKINIPDTVESIGQQAFQSCTGAKSIYIGKGVKSLNYALFYSCSSAKEITVAGDLTSISKLTFANCGHCLSYDFPNCTSVPQLVDINAFQNMNPECKIYVPPHLLDEWRTATNWVNYYHMIEPSGLGMSYTGEAYVVRGRGSCTDSVVVIPETYDDGVHGEYPVTGIGKEDDLAQDSAFCNDKLIETVILPTTHSFTVYSNAFRNSTLKRVINYQDGLSLWSSGLSLEYISFVSGASLESYDFCNLASTNVTYDFSKVTSVAPLYDVSYITVGEGTKILVPPHLLDEWKVATNWVEYSDYIFAAE